MPIQKLDISISVYQIYYKTLYDNKICFIKPEYYYFYYLIFSLLFSYTYIVQIRIILQLVDATDIYSFQPLPTHNTTV